LRPQQLDCCRWRRRPLGAIARQDYIYTLPFSLTGWPVVTVRARSAEDGMPIGAQVAGPPWHEAEVLVLAMAIERVTGGWQPPRSGALP
jgi:Asp-tRNA(Asn)/Glu-tRNA(Gln) amidotransferase A subunit family amidase